MPAWNIPKAFMNLSGLTAVGSAAAAGVAVYAQRRHLPLPAAAVLWHTAAVGTAVSVCSTERLAQRCIGLFGKDRSTGHIGWLRYLLMWPYHAAVMAAVVLYRATSREELATKLAEGLFVGGWPLSDASLPGGQLALLDVTNELHAKVHASAYKVVPSWETHGLEADDIEEGVCWALRQQQQLGRSVLVYCTHGHGRSAAMAAALLIAMGQAAAPDAALEQVKRVRPGASPNQRQVQQLKVWANGMEAASASHLTS